MKIAEKRAAHAKLVGELQALLNKMEEGPLSEAEGKDATAKAKEAEALQAQIDEYERLNGIVTKSREVVDPPLPETKEQKAAVAASGENEIAGYLTLGEATVMSPAFRSFAESNFPKGHFPILAVETLRGVKGTRTGYMPLTKRMRQEWEAKAVPTLGAGVIEPMRLSDITQAVANDQTVLRDVLNVSRTGATDSVSYVRRESFTRAATPVAHAAAKPEAALEYAIDTATVRTLAVWIPVTVQMLSDWPALRNLIDTDLLYDLRKVEEEQVMYGDGTGQNFDGIVPNAGHDIAVADNRVTSPTIVDQIRVGMTEVRTSGYQPNALVIHPIDWEEVVLTKGDDDHYLAQIFPSADGGMRVWGLRVVETVAAEENAGVATEARNLVVGDFQRGATLWIREEANVQVGMKNDDFTKNLRTVLAEERAAFAVRAPDAFAVLETQASAT
jgi:HK97 family phage major capsid protein